MMFREQCEWAKEEGVDFIIVETVDQLGEALVALEEVLRVNLPAVVTLSIHQSGKLVSGEEPEIAAQILANAGATVVGFNCGRGPATMYPILKRTKPLLPPNVGLAGLPVPFRTTPTHPTMQSLCRHETMYQELEPYTLTRAEIADWAKKFHEIGVNYMGLCCGGEPYTIRAMCEALGRKTMASSFSPDLTKHFAFGNDKNLSPLFTNPKYKNDL